MSDNLPDLLPCPFCGGEAYAMIESDFERRNPWTAYCRCEKCYAQSTACGYSDYDKCLKDAIEAWNRRR